MTRPVLLLAALILAEVAHAQTTASRGAAAPVVGAVKYAGRYDVTTGVWTRAARSIARGTLDTTLYSNTALSGYYDDAVGPTGFAAGGAFVDTGAVPSSDYDGPVVLQLPWDVSVVDGVRIAYCDFEQTPASSGWSLDFYESYASCTSAPDPQQLVGAVTATSLPSAGCWIVDLTFTPFELRSGGDARWDGVQELDTFGVAWRYAGTGGTVAGPLLAGNPAGTDGGWMPGDLPSAGSNTFYGGPGGCPGVGTGLFNDDRVQVLAAPGSTSSGCYFFGGYSNPGGGCGAPLATPHMGLALELHGTDALACATVCIASDYGCDGLPNSTGQPAFGLAFGTARVADGNVTLSGFDLPPNQSCLFATSLGGLDPGIPSGNGLLCLDPLGPGGIGRFVALGQVKNSGALGQVDLSTLAGEWDLSMIPTSTGTYAATVGFTSHFQLWYRDVVGAGYNFSNSFSITWR